MLNDNGYEAFKQRFYMSGQLDAMAGNLHTLFKQYKLAWEDWWYEEWCAWGTLASNNGTLLGDIVADALLQWMYYGTDTYLSRFYQAFRVAMEDMRDAKAQQESAWSRVIKRELMDPTPILLDQVGYIYVIRAADRYKIGRETQPRNRVKQHQTASPYYVELLIDIEVGDAIAAESDLHRMFADKRVKGEWFLLEEQDVEVIKQYLEMAV